MMLATEKKQVDKLWDVIVDTYGRPRYTILPFGNTKHGHPGMGTKKGRTHRK